MTTQIQKVERQQLAVGINVETLLDKAIDAKSAVEVVKELRLMRLDDQARSAKAQFDEAMSAFQEKCPVIIKDKAVPDRNGNTAYKYAPIEMIEVQIRPLLREFGFSHTFDTDTASAQGWVIAICKVKHRAGHSESSTAKFPLGTKTQIMSDTQVYAAALTFANRRALCNAYGLILAGEDMDGRTGNPKPKGPRKATETTRNWALEQLRPVHRKLQEHAIDSGWIMPNEGLDQWDLEHVPTTKQELDKLKNLLERI